MSFILLFLLIFVPFALTLWNIVSFIIYLIKKVERKYVKFLELLSMCIGAFFTLMYIGLIEIQFVEWYEQLHNFQVHSMVSTSNFSTIMTLIIIGFISYCILRFIPAKRQSPLISAIGIAGTYIGIIICVVWNIQTIHDPWLIIFPANCILIYIKVILITVYSKNQLIQTYQVSIKYKKLACLLNDSTKLPLLGLLFLIPLLGIIVCILFLFGQEPNSMIKAWTETADWTLSQWIAPQNIFYDEHYLCTVAAGGHKKVVKPIRNGIRHGHQVTVNRQLCVANAFEQVLEEKMPRTHKLIRTIYDHTGYPISKHIKSKVIADIIYFIMKPLEWIFLIVLYFVDVHPEDRIAVQYPHKRLEL